MKNVLEYLEKTSKKFPEKKAFIDDNDSYMYSQLLDLSQRIGSNISIGIKKKPIAVYIDKSIQVIASFMGILYSGNYYCPIDTEMPIERVKVIFNTLKPIAVITDKKNIRNIEGIMSCNLIIFEEIINRGKDMEYLDVVRKTQLDIDPAYVLFTSGSTGIPKGVVICHQSIIDYIEWVSKTFNITNDDSFGNQAPFYFDNSILDIYTGIKNGASVFIMPKECFVFPVDAVNYLNQNKITTIFWVPSALCNVAKLRVLSKIKLETVNKVLFCGEVMPNKQLNYWRKNHQKAIYANLYGPTEITDVCSYYIVDREFLDDEPLPIGKACDNTELLILNERNSLVETNEIGELCVRGCGLSLGYYANFEKTSEVFIQNPLNHEYQDLIYRTGDLAKINERGEIIYLGRKDYQIKHMGYRIELGEIETAVMGIETITDAVCIYDDKKKRIVLFYTGREENIRTIKDKVCNKLPEYMIPGISIYLDKFPYNANGKIDRKKLKETIYT